MMSPALAQVHPRTQGGGAILDEASEQGPRLKDSTKQNTGVNSYCAATQEDDVGALGAEAQQTSSHPEGEPGRRAREPEAAQGARRRRR